MKLYELYEALTGFHMPKMSNKELIYHSFIKSRMFETLGTTLLFRFRNMFYSASLESNYF